MSDPDSTPLPRRTLAEQMADTLTEEIVAGKYPPGAPLPIEPQLAKRFGVSRAVVRDATRMLAARGLVDAKHGRGVYVTESTVAPFSEALLLALRRAGATVWDVERFEQMILPEVLAEAARQAGDAEIAAIRGLVEEYLAVFAEESRANEGRDPLPDEARERVLAAFRAVYGAIFAATHNAVWALLAESVLRLRALRSWQSGGLSVDDIIALERRHLMARVEAIAARDPDRARATGDALTALPPEAVAAMRTTPVGQTVEIPAALRVAIDE